MLGRSPSTNAREAYSIGSWSRRQMAREAINCNANCYTIVCRMKKADGGNLMGKSRPSRSRKSTGGLTGSLKVRLDAESKACLTREAELPCA